LFAPELNFSVLERMFEEGAVVKATTLTDNFTLKQFRATYGQRAIILFCVDGHRRLKIRTAQTPFEPLPGDTVIAILPVGDSPENPPEDRRSDAALIS
jgi:hypothetical protein